MAAGRNEEFYEGDRDEVLSTAVSARRCKRCSHAGGAVVDS
jgi:hypothetical protein